MDDPFRVTTAKPLKLLYHTLILARDIIEKIVKNSLSHSQLVRLAPLCDCNGTRTHNHLVRKHSPI